MYIQNVLSTKNAPNETADVISYINKLHADALMKAMMINDVGNNTHNHEQIDQRYW